MVVGLGSLHIQRLPRSVYGTTAGEHFDMHRSLVPRFGVSSRAQASSYKHPPLLLISRPRADHPSASEFLNGEGRPE